MDKSSFKEYYAWLQPQAKLPFTCAEICAPDSGSAAFAAGELKRGLLWLDDKLTIGNKGYRITFSEDNDIASEGYSLQGSEQGLSIAASGRAGFLYGTYAFIRHLSLKSDITKLNITSVPKVKHRMLNHWDNMNGSIERGYSGPSLFYSNGKFSYDPKRMEDYARLLASIGINEAAINNVNVGPDSIKLITEELLPDVAKLAGIFRPFCIKLLIAIDFESPVKLGGLATADPLEESVIKWWRDAAALVYSYVPDLAGFLVKADSEFRGGPAAMGRTQADGANMLAGVLSRHNAKVYWRCFVYNCMQDWRDTRTDRPKAAYDNFAHLDGMYHKDVILQIKNGPVDFQVREPNSPLFGAMKQTAMAVEFQVTQEYTGHQIDLYALAVQWEEFFKTPAAEGILTSDLAGKEIMAVSAVSNTGSDDNWTGHLLAQANLYAFGRLAWDCSLTASVLTDEWIQLTFGFDSKLSALKDMMLASRSVYEKYNAPLGIGWMVNPGNHYGPSPDGYEYMKWGTYHRADTAAIGVDRTKNGTGLTAQYGGWLDDYYSNTDTCPEELLLFFHRLPYDFKLKSGKTLLQHIYDTHFEGADEVLGFIDTWQSLKDVLPESAYESVLSRLNRQLENAKEWRDVINTYFLRKTGIPDEKGRKIYT